MGIPELLTITLIAMRLGGLIVAMPLLSSGPVPGPVRILIGFAFAATIQPMVGTLPQTLWNANDVIVLLAVHELCIGLMMGYVVRLMFLSVSLALEVAGLQIGFAMASIFDPINNSQVSVLAQVGVVMTVLTFFGANLHHDIFAGVVHSFTAVPIGLPEYAMGGYVQQVGALLGDAMLIGLRLAMPAMIVMLLVHTVLGIVARAAPQMNLFMNITFIVNIVVGVLVLMLSMPRFMPAFVNYARATIRHGLGLW